MDLSITEVNKLVIEFLKSIDDESVDEIVKRWSSEENQGLLVPIKGKQTRHKSVYLHFCDYERERLRNLNPPVIKKDEIKVIMSKNWSLLKEKGGPEYQKFLDLCNGGKPEYEVSKPFHKFSLLKRKEFEDNYPKESASSITGRLKEEWRNLDREEKNEYKLS
jgi:hypothetical protein